MCRSKVSSQFNCAFLVVHHFGKPGIVKRKSVHSLIGSSAWGNFAESIIGLERYSETRPTDYKKLDFLLRTARSPEPICLYRNPQTLLFESKAESGNMAAMPIECVRDVLRERGQDASFTELQILLQNELGISEGHAKRLISNAKEEGIITKGAGRHGKYSCVD